MSLKRLYHAGLFVRLPVNNEELTSEIKLHRSVLDQAILDMFSIDPAVKKDVDNWLYLNNPDFIEACLRADLDPSLCYEVFIRVKEIFKNQKHATPFNS